MKYFWLKDDHIITDQEDYFVLAEEYPFNKNYYIIGYDYKKTIVDEEFIEIDPSLNPITGNLNELYIVEEEFLYKPNHCYLNKVQYILDGPFPSITKTTRYLNLNRDSLMATLFEMYNGNYLNIYFRWGIDDGKDFDMKVSILDEHYGYGFIKEKYGHWAHHYLDTEEAPGFEKISFNRSYLVDSYQDNPVEIILRGHWFKEKRDGNIILIIASTKNFYKKTIHIDIETQRVLSNDDFNYIGVITYYPLSDRFTYKPNREIFVER